MDNHNSEHTVDGAQHASSGGSLSEPACDLAELATRFGTPLLVIDEGVLRARMREFRTAFSRDGWRCRVVYAAKALMLMAIARISEQEALDLDVCSEGELQTVLQAGVSASRCIMHGCAKTPAELELAVSSGVAHIVVDNEPEIRALAVIAKRTGVRTSVLIRVNPAVKADTLAQVQTSAPDSKFGFPVSDGQAIAAVESVLAFQSLDFAGIHCHIGSQIFDLEPYAREVQALASVVGAIASACGTRCRVLNIGGGLGFDDGPSAAGAPTPQMWATAVLDALDRCFPPGDEQRPLLMVEPGRALIAPAGMTLYRVAVRKTMANGAQALIVDGGMSDNPRPALYEAVYPVHLGTRSTDEPDGRYMIFGRHCETDLLFRNVPLPDPRPGEVLVVRNTGAYTYSMASNYNRFPKIAVVLRNSEGANLIARREPVGHMLDLDVSGDASNVKTRLEPQPAP
ncbi:MAG: diaminopimelate decarboxylase [Candidatus Eremiobacter antarcticus]|nr:diaminopimelate decarboxylase [Candidatus Eremiobacteraeota bacterium]MBC5808198.1 diaminopimelate decarboxylase [Candidatus Eremiobacteraeota bacterium]